MVFFFYPRGYVEGSDAWLIYMGKDKHENEDLIKYSWPVDVWFHVDDMSSAHVYLRLPEAGFPLSDIPIETLEDCAQLVKANSINGCKVNNVQIVYTLASNLKKTAAMDVGQVGFHDQKAVLKTRVDRKNNDVLNRLEKTRQEKYPDLAADKEAYENHVRSVRRQEEKASRAAYKAAKDETRRVEDMRSYKSLMQDEYMVSNKEVASKYRSVEEAEDDFM